MVHAQSVEVRICTSLELQFLLSWAMLGMTFDFMAKDHMLHFCVTGVAIVFGAAWWRHLETALARGANNLGQNELPRAKGSWAEPSWAEPSLSQERLVYKDHIQTLSAADRERRADPSDPTSKLPVMTRNKSQDEIKKIHGLEHTKGIKHIQISQVISIVFIMFIPDLPGSPQAEGRFEQSQSFADRLESQVALPVAFLAGRVDKFGSPRAPNPKLQEVWEVPVRNNCRASHTGDACRERERGISSELADMTCCELHLRCRHRHCRRRCRCCCRRCCCCFWSSVSFSFSFSFLFVLSLSLSLLSSLSSLSSLSLSSSSSSSSSSWLLLLLLFLFLLLLLLLLLSLLLLL